MSRFLRQILPLWGLALVLISSPLSAQDAQFSQYYSVPLFLNPAMTGLTECYQAGVAARTQWTGLERPYTTGVAFADVSYPDLRQGFGVMAIYDDVGEPRLNTTELSLLYARHVALSNKVHLRLGLQGTSTWRSVGYSDLVFSDQFTGGVQTQNTTQDQVVESDRVQYFDLSAGLFFYHEESYFLGVATHHLTEPNQAFSTESKLPRKLSVHGGYHINLSEANEWELTPGFLYRAQGKFDQLDLGAYASHKPFLVGLWFRSLLIKQTDGIRNVDALSIHAGVKSGGFSFVYSYDYTLSSLENRSTKGAHEITLLTDFCIFKDDRKPPMRSRRAACPKFLRKHW